MLGAIIGDIVGSRFEWDNYKGKDFDFFTFLDERLMKILVDFEKSYPK